MEKGSECTYVMDLPPDAIALTVQSFVRPKSKSVAFTTLDNQRTAEAIDRSFGGRAGVMEAERSAKR